MLLRSCVLLLLAVLVGCATTDRVQDALLRRSGGALTLLPHLEQALKSRDPRALAPLLTPRCRRQCPGFIPYMVSDRGGGYDVARWLPRLEGQAAVTGEPVVSGVSELLVDLTRITSSYGQIATARVEPLELQVFQGLVHARCALTLGGRDLEGHPRVDRGLVDLKLRRGPSGWRVAALRPARVTTLRRAERGYVEIGLSKALAAPRRRGRVDLRSPGTRLWTQPWVALDLDGDGRPELVTARGHRVLAVQPRPTPTVRELFNVGISPIRALAAGDVDGDGRPDLFVGTHGGGGRLWLNRPDGFALLPSFRVSGWISAAVFADFDRDGHLDLYVVRHGDGRDLVRPGQVDLLFRGGPHGPRPGPLEGARGRGLAVCAGDLDGDGDTDLFVANEGTEPSRVLLNVSGALKPVDALERSPVQASTCALGDVNGDGRLDLFVGARGATIGRALASTGLGPLATRQARRRLARITAGSGLWLNRSGRRGLRLVRASGLGPLASWTAWSGLVDHDSDGNLDLLTLGRRPGPALEYRWLQRVAAPLARDAPPQPLVVPPPPPRPARLWLNLGPGRGWAEAALPAGAIRAGLGAAATISEGRPLLVLESNDGERSHLLRWRGEAEERHVGLLRLVGSGPNRDAVGARVELRLGQRLQIREVGSASGLPGGPPGFVHLGVAGTLRLPEVRVRWPNGTWQRFVDLPTDQLVVLRQGGHASWAGQAGHGATALPPASAPVTVQPPPATLASSGPIPDRLLELTAVGPHQGKVPLARFVGPGRATALLLLGSSTSVDLCNSLARAVKRRPGVSAFALTLGPPPPRCGLRVLQATPATRAALIKIKALTPAVILVNAAGQTRRVISGGLSAGALEGYLDQLVSGD